MVLFLCNYIQILPAKASRLGHFLIPQGHS
jgi:hypothetical protein